MASRKTKGDTPKEEFVRKQDPRLTRIRENQRRSRARRREYLEDLESRWKKCQELGVQADIELQRAARKVIEENSLLRKLLAELGLEASEVDKRLKVLRETNTTYGEASTDIGDNGCHGIGPGMVGSRGSHSQTLSEPTEKTNRPTSLRENTEADLIDLSQIDIGTPRVETDASPLPSIDQSPDPYMGLLEPTPDYDNIFDISDFLEPLDISPPSPGVGPAQNQQEPSSPCLDTVALNSALPTSTTVLPHESPGAYESTLKDTTTPCTEAYALLKSINAQRQEHKDMFEIIIELWDGFCCSGPGCGIEGKGCRVDNQVLQNVIDRMK